MCGGTVVVLFSILLEKIKCKLDNDVVQYDFQSIQQRFL